MFTNLIYGPYIFLNIFFILDSVQLFFVSIFKLFLMFLFLCLDKNRFKSK